MVASNAIGDIPNPSAPGQFMIRLVASKRPSVTARLRRARLAIIGVRLGKSSQSAAVLAPTAIRLPPVAPTRASGSSPKDHSQGNAITDAAIPTIAAAIVTRPIRVGPSSRSIS